MPFSGSTSSWQKLSALVGGNTNDSASGSGADFDHNLTYTLPAGFLVVGRVIRVTAAWLGTFGLAPSTMLLKLKLGTVTVYSGAPTTPGTGLTGVGITTQFLLQAVAAPGASVGVECSIVTIPDAFSFNSRANNTASPINIATNASQAVKATSFWTAAGTGTNTIKLAQFIVEAL